MPNKHIPKPLYNPCMPFDLYTFLTQSIMPVNSRVLLLLPKSTAILVRAKSKGYTKKMVSDPAKPPAKIFPITNFDFSFLGSYGFTNLLIRSLNAKFNAYVGKYLITLAKFPLHNDQKPSSFTHLFKQSAIPKYFFF